MVTALSTACSADPETDQGESEIVENNAVTTKTKAFSGTFGFAIDGHKFKMSFDVTQIDWNAKTAVFSSRILDNGGDYRLAPDNAVRTTIAIMRCPGCYTFEVTSDMKPLARLTFSSSALTEMQYLDLPATADITSASATDKAPPPKPVGGDACELFCKGGKTVACRAVDDASTCTIDKFPPSPGCDVWYTPGKACK